MGCLNSSSTKRPIKSRVNQGLHQGVKELKQNYRISADTKVLGAGAFGKVFLSESIADPSFKVAIKVLNKSKLGGKIDDIKDEVKILTTLDHPNIVKYYETYDDVKYMYLVMEYCPGGELFDKIASQKNQVFNETDACVIMKKMLRAINHCHANRITHRDIKPENIMIGADGELKLIDFGLSKQGKFKNSHMTTIAGTPHYMAPEVLDGDYNFKCDIWSLGVLMYVLLSGYLPFYGDNKAEVFNKITAGKFSFKHKEFEAVSNEAKELIKKMLQKDPDDRISGTDALKDPWFLKFKKHQELTKEDEQLDKEVLTRLRKYRGVSHLKKACMNMLVKMLDTKEIENLREMFLKLDTNGTGWLTMGQLQQAIKDADNPISDKEIEQIVKEIDYQGNKKINYTEFLAATISVKKFLTEEKMLALFKQFDTDNSGKITIDNIIGAMHKMNHEVTENDIKEIMEKHNLKNNKHLDYNDFKTIFKEIN